MLGVIVAVAVQLEVIRATWLAAQERAILAEDELPLDKLPHDIPRWFYLWFPWARDHCRDLCAKMPELIDNPLMLAFSQPICDLALLTDPDAVQVPLNPDTKLDIGTLRLLRTARRDYDKLRRDERGLRGFYDGVRKVFKAGGRPVPTARDIALLAAAAGLEPLEPSLNDTRRRWENRIGRWKREKEGPA